MSTAPQSVLDSITTGIVSFVEGCKRHHAAVANVRRADGEGVVDGLGDAAAALDECCATLRVAQESITTFLSPADPA